jgi:NCS1 family nucleobase:cation symporter-1
MGFRYAAPVLLALSAALLWWAWSAAGGVGPMLSAPSQFAAGSAMEGRFWSTFVPALTANVGYWATLALNIPDFSRWALPAAPSGAGPS